MTAAVIAHFELPKAWGGVAAMKKVFIRWSHTCETFELGKIETWR